MYISTCNYCHCTYTILLIFIKCKLLVFYLSVMGMSLEGNLSSSNSVHYLSKRHYYVITDSKEYIFVNITHTYMNYYTGIVIWQPLLTRLLPSLPSFLSIWQKERFITDCQTCIPVGQYYWKCKLITFTFNWEYVINGHFKTNLFHRLTVAKT